MPEYLISEGICDLWIFSDLICEYADKLKSISRTTHSKKLILLYIEIILKFNFILNMLLTIQNAAFETRASVRENKSNGVRFRRYYLTPRFFIYFLIAFHVACLNLSSKLVYASLFSSNRIFDISAFFLSTKS